MSPQVKAEIDAMSHEELARILRFAPSPHPYFRADTGTYFLRRFRELGGMTPEISKRIGCTP